jgi:hypothetical protein
MCPPAPLLRSGGVVGSGPSLADPKLHESRTGVSRNSPEERNPYRLPYFIKQQLSEIIMLHCKSDGH